MKKTTKRQVEIFNKLIDDRIEKIVEDRAQSFFLNILSKVERSTADGAEIIQFKAKHQTLYPDMSIAAAVEDPLIKLKLMGVEIQLTDKITFKIESITTTSSDNFLLTACLLFGNDSCHPLEEAIVVDFLVNIMSHGQEYCSIESTMRFESFNENKRIYLDKINPSSLGDGVTAQVHVTSKH